MPRHAFLVLGYGVPNNILKDENYGVYLRAVFNRIYAQCVATGTWNPVIIFSGGKTDMIKPYRRTEAQEMIRFFRTLMRRPSLKRCTSKWFLIPERQAFSTLDNFLYAAKILSKRKLLKSRLTVFGEETRRTRISVIAKKTFKKVNVVTIDFDQSPNRYLDPDFLLHKESEALKLDLWALRSATNLRKHRALIKKKFVFLRRAGHKKHAQTVMQWWEKELRELASSRARTRKARPS